MHNSLDYHHSMIALFDVDGVLNSCVFADYAQIGIDPDLMQPFWRGDFKDCLLGQKDTKQVVSSYLKEWGYTGSVDDFFQFWHESEKFLYPDVIEAIEQLARHMDVYTATNQDHYRLEYMRNEMQLGRVFKQLYASCTIGALKPDEVFYRFILNDLDVHPSDVLYWDDSKVNVEVASSLGIEAYHVENKEMLIREITSYSL